MTTLVLGVSHRTAAHPALERFVLTASEAAGLLDRLARSAAVTEVVVLATCNRVEVYLETGHPDLAAEETAEALGAATGTTADDVRGVLYTHRGGEAVGHLFRVVCGLDSVAVGESQIRGQLRAAYNLAFAHRSTGPVLNGLFQHALYTGKRVESTTGLGRSASGLVTVALEAAADALGPLAGRPALVVGAGALGALGVTALKRAGVDDITVVNRGLESARRLAGRHGVRAAALGELPALLSRADVVVVATGAREAVVTDDVVTAARGDRPGRAVALVDLSLPRNIDPAVARWPGVHLIDLAGLEARLREVSARVPVEEAHHIVAEETEAFLASRRVDRVTPLIVAMRENALSVADAEVDRLLGRTPALTERMRGEVEQTARRIAEKLIHRPTVRVREMVSEPGGHAYVAVLHDLFGAPEPLALQEPKTGGGAP
ncbi:glutamyl-tRNA reductase [Streptomyces beigongshangae]|uniref:glutamyl-tRNA reductase n=1 Tax=Streptomyces beigongshangae TaxID=2841597 RepID=UPI001C85136E|nr:glutamyl-tRNA reductase [Streptomyces sp. REN17]